MNRRLRTLTGPKPIAKSDRFLKPGALARMRDFKISARSPSRFVPKIQKSPATPERPISAVDGSPCFTGTICGPRFLNRKKILSSKRIFFVPSSPELVAEPGLDLFGTDLLIAH